MSITLRICKRGHTIEIKEDGDNSLLRYKGTFKEEMSAAAEGYLAYAGPYEVDDKNHIVTHHMSVSMNPTWLGDTQPRYVKLDSDILEITSPLIIVDGKEQNTKLVWKKVK